MLAAIAPTALLCMQVISFYEEIIFEWIQNVIQNQIRKEQKVFRPLKKKNKFGFWNICGLKNV